MGLPMSATVDARPPRRPARWQVPPWRWALRITLALSLAVGLAGLPPFVFRKSGLDRYFELAARVDHLRAKNRERRRANALLRAEARDLEGDLAMIEKVARDQLGLVRPGEVIYQVGASGVASVDGAPPRGRSP